MNLLRRQVLAVAFVVRITDFQEILLKSLEVALLQANANLEQLVLVRQSVDITCLRVFSQLTALALLPLVQPEGTK